ATALRQFQRYLQAVVELRHHRRRQLADDGWTRCSATIARNRQPTTGFCVGPAAVVADRRAATDSTSREPVQPLYVSCGGSNDPPRPCTTGADTRGRGRGGRRRQSNP